MQKKCFIYSVESNFGWFNVERSASRLEWWLISRWSVIDSRFTVKIRNSFLTRNPQIACFLKGARTLVKKLWMSSSCKLLDIVFGKAEISMEAWKERNWNWCMMGGKETHKQNVTWFMKSHCVQINHERVLLSTIHDTEKTKSAVPEKIYR